MPCSRKHFFDYEGFGRTPGYRYGMNIWEDAMAHTRIRSQIVLELYVDFRYVSGYKANLQDYRRIVIVIIIEYICHTVVNMAGFSSKNILSALSHF
jgi:hypothetical protein